MFELFLPVCHSALSGYGALYDTTPALDRKKKEIASGEARSFSGPRLSQIRKFARGEAEGKP